MSTTHLQEGFDPVQLAAASTTEGKDPRRRLAESVGLANLTLSDIEPLDGMAPFEGLKPFEGMEPFEDLAPIDRPAPHGAMQPVGDLHAGPARVLPAATPWRATQRSSALWFLLIPDAVSLILAVVFGQLLDLALSGRGSIAASLTSVVYLPVLLGTLNCYGMYERRRRRLVATSFPDLNRLVHSLVVASLILLFVAGGAHRWIGLPTIDRVGMAFIAVLALAGVPFGRALARRLRLRHPGCRRSNILIVGSGLIATSVAARLSKVDGMRVVGCIDDNALSRDEPPTSLAFLGGLDQLPSLILTHDIDHVVVAFSPATGAELAALLRSLAGRVQISVVPRLFDLLTVRSRVDDIAGLTVVDVAPASLGLTERFAKRAFDVAVSGFGLLVLSPVMVVVALLVKCTSPGGVFFRQSRTGRGSNSFMIYKFRTMRAGAESERQDLVERNEVDGPLFKMKSDPRITRVGRTLRQTSLDELPQLINVFKGDMSLVGPRPFVTEESAEIDGWAARRFDVRPGMTGLWQTSGRNDLPFDELRRLDHAYVASWSLWWDARILWHTPGIVFRRHGAY